MEYFAGLDVATEETSICVIDGAGSIVLEAAVATEPEAICKALRKHLPRLRRVGHEAGSLSPWLQTELTKLGLPAVCLEARHTRAALAAQRNKTDRADARGIAHIMRTGWFRQVHVKSRDSYRLRLLLNQRSNLKRKFLDIENAIRHSIKAFGIKVGRVSRGQFEARVRDLVADDPLIAGLTDCMLRARAALWQEYLRLHQVVVAMVARDETCARFMRIPGVGPISALAFKTAVDDPRRFRRSRTVGAYLGLYVAALAIGGVDRHPRTHLEGRGQGREARSVRGRQPDADPLQGMVGAQGLGVEDRRPAWPQAGLRGGRAQARRHHARDVAGRVRVPI